MGSSHAPRAVCPRHASGSLEGHRKCLERLVGWLKQVRPCPTTGFFAALSEGSDENDIPPGRGHPSPGEALSGKRHLPGRHAWRSVTSWAICDQVVTADGSGPTEWTSQQISNTQSPATSMIRSSALRISSGVCA